MSTEQNPASEKAEGPSVPAPASATPPETETKTEKTEIKPVDAPPLVPSLDGVVPAPSLVIEPATNVGGSPSSAAFKLHVIQALDKLSIPKLSRRTRWRALMAASMVLAAGVGATVAAIAMSRHSSSSAALLEAHAVQERAASKEREQMQLTVAKLNKEIAALKANIESSVKSTNSQIGKLNERLAEKLGEKAKDEKAEAARRAAISSETTGSIAAPAAVPVPAPRPQIVDAKPAIVDGWSIRSAREGLVLVEGRGEIFEVVPGAPLPGLGRVEDVRRQSDGRWVVVTPKGLIVAAARPRATLYDRY